MELKELQKHWNAFGERDPLWAILATPGKRFGRWDVDEFFRTGEVQIDGLMDEIAEAVFPIGRSKALDFGSGVGRLTQALAKHFDECVGIDIAPSMIEQARAYNRHGDRVSYLLNEADDLRAFADDTFDLIFTTMVLQHMQPKFILAYVAEFVRVIAPGGLAVFHIPHGELVGDPHGELVGEEDGCAGPTEIISKAPIAPSAARAWIRVAMPPTTIGCGQKRPVEVQVRNVGDAPWPQFGLAEDRFLLRMGNRWYDEAGRIVDLYEERVSLPRTLRPGEEGTVHLVITGPPEPGRYTLELDMAQEWVGWFAGMGSTPARFAVDVEPDPSEPEKFSPEIQMYCVRKDEVVAAVEQAGGRVVKAERVNVGITGTIEYHYYVTK